jgi:hypothetical protein
MMDSLRKAKKQQLDDWLQIAVPKETCLSNIKDMLINFAECSQSPSLTYHLRLALAGLKAKEREHFLKLLTTETLPHLRPEEIESLFEDATQACVLVLLNESKCNDELTRNIVRKFLADHLAEQRLELWKTFIDQPTLPSRWQYLTPRRLNWLISLVLPAYLPVDFAEAFWPMFKADDSLAKIRRVTCWYVEKALKMNSDRTEFFPVVHGDFSLSQTLRNIYTLNELAADLFASQPRSRDASPVRN